MNRKLSDWASVAEIVSGFAVVVTLAMLVLGVRENTATTRVSVYSEIVEGFNETDRNIFTDPDLERIYDAYWAMEIGGLDETEIAQVRRIGLITLRNLEKAYFARQYDVIGEDEWRRMQASICLNSERAANAGMLVRDIGVLTEEFRDYAESTCVTN